jgi:hypothetical protein
MAHPKRPEFKLTGNTALDKDPVTQATDHYKKPLLEISALRSSMPNEALSVIR